MTTFGQYLWSLLKKRIEIEVVNHLRDTLFEHGFKLKDPSVHHSGKTPPYFECKVCARSSNKCEKEITHQIDCKIGAISNMLEDYKCELEMEERNHDDYS